MGEGRGEDPQRPEPQEAQAVEAQPRTQAEAHHHGDTGANARKALLTAWSTTRKTCTPV